jgi:hypothetical protein
MKQIAKFLRSFLLALVVSPGWVLAGAAERAEGPGRSADPPSTVILISLDGTRPADLNRDDMPALMGLADRGLRAEKLLPVLPTNTFPNHVTLITGVKPERHGIVNNRFIDPELGPFDRADIPRWIEIEPLWSLLERRGVASASYHWVGSEGRWPSGEAPRHWVPFSEQVPEIEKVQTILHWLSLPDLDARPRFISSWFRGADHAGHRYGPGHEEVQRDLKRQDLAIRALWQGLRDRGLLESTTVLFVSDHGMMSVETRADLGMALKKDGVRFEALGIGGFAIVYLEDASAKGVNRVVDTVRGMGLSADSRVGASKALPVNNPRFGDVIVTAPAGTAITYPGLSLEGFHGYSPNEPAMAGIFIAVGRLVPKDLVVPVVRSIDVAPTVLALLGEPVPHWMEGRPLPEFVTTARKTGELLPTILSAGQMAPDRSLP